MGGWGSAPVPDTLAVGGPRHLAVLQLLLLPLPRLPPPAPAWATLPDTLAAAFALANPALPPSLLLPIMQPLHLPLLLLLCNPAASQMRLPMRDPASSVAAHDPAAPVRWAPARLPDVLALARTLPLMPLLLPLPRLPWRMGSGPTPCRSRYPCCHPSSPHEGQLKGLTRSWRGCARPHPDLCPCCCSWGMGFSPTPWHDCGHHPRPSPAAPAPAAPAPVPAPAAPAQWASALIPGALALALAPPLPLPLCCCSCCVFPMSIRATTLWASFTRSRPVPAPASAASAAPAGQMGFSPTP